MSSIQFQVDSDRPPVARAARSGPQFGLKALLLGVAVISLVMAVASQGGLYPTMALSLLLLLIAAHVAGNAIGTTRRDRSPDDASGAPPGPPRGAPIERAPAMPVTKLRESIPLSRRVLVDVTIGALLGTATTGWGTYGSWAQFGAAGVAIIALSSAVLGAYVGFMASRFVAAFGRAFRQSKLQAKR